MSLVVERHSETEGSRLVHLKFFGEFGTSVLRKRIQIKVEICGDALNLLDLFGVRRVIRPGVQGAARPWLGGSGGSAPRKVNGIHELGLRGSLIGLKMRGLCFGL